MRKDKMHRVLGLAACLLLMLGMVGCVQAKPPREREPLPTVVVAVAPIEAAVVDVAEVDGDVDADAEADEDALVEEPELGVIDDEASEDEAAEDEALTGAEEPAEVDATPTATPEPLPTPTPYTGPLYVVAPGDTLSTIAALHGSTVQAFLEANSLKSGAALRVGQELRLPDGVDPLYEVDDIETDLYIVRFGDTLNQIAALHRMPVGQLMALNPTLRNPNLLRPGMELTVAVNPIPEGAVVHVVQPGQTLASIARRYGVDVQELAQKNHVTDVNRLDVGQVLVIPQP